MIVYTCNFGNYDKLISPKVTPNEVIFICFTDNPSCCDGTAWQPIPIATKSPMECAKHYKWTAWMKPMRYFGLKFPVSFMYIDANVEITQDVRCLARLSGRDFFTREHRNRKNVWEELQACIELRKGKISKITSYVANNYENIAENENQIVYENGLLIFPLSAHNNDRLKEMCLEISKDLRVCTRDQLILPAKVEDYKISVGLIKNDYKNYLKFRKNHNL